MRPDPPPAIREMARALKPGGVLVVTGADTHTHEWLRTEQRDRWLSFARADIARWFEAAGLQEVKVEDTIVPITTTHVALGAGDALDRVEEIALRARDASAVETAAALAVAVMRRRHPGAQTYDIIVPRELLRERLRAQRTFDAVLLGIGSPPAPVNASADLRGCSVQFALEAV